MTTATILEEPVSQPTVGFLFSPTAPSEETLRTGLGQETKVLVPTPNGSETLASLCPPWQLLRWAELSSQPSHDITLPPKQGMA